MIDVFVEQIPSERAAFLYSHIYLISIILLFMMIPLMRRHFSTRINLGHRLFMGLIYLDVSILVIDWATWLLYGQEFYGAVVLHHVLMTLFYALDAVILFVWVLYCVFKLYRTKTAVKMRMPIYGSVLFIAMCILLTNPFTGWIFNIDEKNIYTRGGGYWLVFLYAMVVLVVIITEVIIYRRRYRESHDNKLYFRLLSVPISVTLARLVQYLIYGAALTWPIFTLAILYTYMNMQASENYFDYLTGLRNRRELEFFINYRIKNYKKSNTLFLLYLDLNDFKSINDKYGHPVGDAALVDAANLLRQACQGTEDFIARLGGDEFGIVGVRSSEQDVEELIKRIDSLSEEFNRTSNLVYHISFSCGVSIHSPGISHDELLSVADQSMYQRKNEYYTKNQVK